MKCKRCDAQMRREKGTNGYYYKCPRCGLEIRAKAKVEKEESTISTDAD